MFEHPFFTEQYTRHQQEEIAHTAERRRSLKERGDQIVPRPAGAVRRMLRRVFRGVAPQPAATRPANRATTSPTATVCDRTAAPAR
ncbi:MAG: hypothetical protein K0Q52_716 [Microbacterium sp.]|jgi:hypothetical protein|nr:hypothetical protein [Microbacterium sp.]